MISASQNFVVLPQWPHELIPVKITVLIDYCRFYGVRSYKLAWPIVDLLRCCHLEVKNQVYECSADVIHGMLHTLQHGEKYNMIERRMGV